jgi:hypothetical protein
MASMLKAPALTQGYTGRISAKETIKALRVGIAAQRNQRSI